MFDDVSSEELPPALLGGRLEGIRLPDLMWALGRRRATGVLSVARGPIERKLYVKDGRIVFATSSDPNDRLGETLLRQGKITLDQLEEALRGLRSGKRLGTLLVDRGTLDPVGLTQAVLSQVRAIALDVLVWDVGEYRFHEGPLPGEEMITLDVRTSEILLEAIRQVGSLARIRASVGPARTVYALADGWEELRQELRLTATEEQILERLAQGVASIHRLCEELTVSSFEIYQGLWAFRVLGMVRELEWVREPQGAATQTGRLGEVDFPELLMRLGRAKQTGLLKVSRRNVERTFHLQRGRCIFATSTDPDDGLPAFLLRRGVIALGDLQELDNRTLSNKRVGTILRELGVIDGADLQVMVRQQLSQIVFDTFEWQDGEFVFTAGDLPSHEHIILDVDVARLVTEGIRRIRSWTRVIRGCGGVDNPLCLGRDAYDLLDRMGAGRHETEVARALDKPQTPRRLCRLLDLEDFRVCQTLWTLKLLGAVEPAPEEDADAVLAGLPEPGPLDPEAALESVGEGGEETHDHAELLGRGAIHPDEVTELPPPVPAGKIDEPVSDEELEVAERVLAAVRPSAPAEEAEPADVAAVPLAPIGEPEPEEDPEPEEPSDAPIRPRLLSALDEKIARFNAMHRLVYKAVRAEIGAGAVNFVRSCCGPDGDTGIDVLIGVTLNEDGSWDAAQLRQAVADQSVEDPWPYYRHVLDREFGLLAPHLGERRAAALQKRIWELDRSKQSRSS